MYIVVSSRLTKSSGLTKFKFNCKFLIYNYMTKINLKQTNRILKALANERRLNILDYLLRTKSATVSDIS